MGRPPKLDHDAVEAWLTAHPEWEESGESIARTYKFRDFSSALAFAVQVGMLAERRDHHPDMEVGWGRARVGWSTHDAGGLTRLDLELAEATDQLLG